MSSAFGRKKEKIALDLSGASVLVVDSDLYAIEMLNQIMRGFGLRDQAAAGSVEEAKDILERKKFYLSIVEAILPDMQGADLVKWMRRHANPDVKHMPIIMVTGLAALNKVEDARDSGASIVLKKPVSSSILFDRIVWSAATDRSFIETESYVGPDRRFKFIGPPNGVGRRSSDLPAEIGEASEPNLHQREIDSLMKPVRVSLD